MILRGGALTKEATISLTFIGQWSSTTRFLIRVWIWGHYPDFCPFRTVGTNSDQGATYCGCTISSPRFTIQNVSTSNICNSCRWLLRARSTIQTRPKRRPNSTNQVEHENLVIIAKMQVCFIFEMNLRAQTFRPLENERLEEAAAGVQLGCRVGEAGGGEGGRHVRGSWIFWRRLFWSVTDVIVYLPPAIVLKIHVKRLRADDVVKHYQISSTNVIILWIQQLCWRHTWREGD